MTFRDFILHMRGDESAASVARRAGIERATLSTYETGRSTPSIDKAARVAAAFDAQLGLFQDGKFYPLEVAE